MNVKTDCPSSPAPEKSPIHSGGSEEDEKDDGDSRHLDGNLSPQSSSDDDFSSDDSCTSETSSSLSIITEDEITLATYDTSVKMENVPEEDGHDENGSQSTIDSSASTNSWVNGSDDELTDPGLHDPYDWETAPLPELNDGRKEDFRFLRNNGKMPIRDEHEGVYRCLECAWEVEYGYCPRCQIWYDGIAPPDCEWHSSTDSEYSDDPDEYESDAAMQYPEAVEQPLPFLPDSKDVSDSDEAASDETTSDVTPDQAQVAHEDKVGQWLRNLAPRLESLNNSTFGLFTSSAQQDSSRHHRREIRSRLATSLCADKDAITELRLERWDHDLFRQMIEKERNEVQETIKQLETQLRNERQEVRRLKEEVALLTTAKDDAAKLKSELVAYKTIVRVKEWDEEVMRKRKERRSVSVAAEELTELRRRKCTPSLLEVNEGGNDPTQSHS